MTYLEDSIECPRCAETIRKNAIACRFCNYGLSNEHYRNCAACDERIRIQAKLCRYCGSSSQIGNSKKVVGVNLSEQSQSGVYGASIKQQVFEVIVRQAMAGAPWRDICNAAMIANGIDPKDIEEELRHRQTGNFAPHHNRDINENSTKNDVEFPYDSVDDNLDTAVKTAKMTAESKKKDKVKGKKKAKKKDKKSSQEIRRF